MLDHRMETFLTVCETMNFTKAAAKLHITQPAVSQHIRYLEAAYDIPLFHYKERKLMLTPEGALLYKAGLAMRMMIGSSVNACTMLARRRSPSILA